MFSYCLYGLLFLKAILFTRQSQQRSSICWPTSKMPPTARAGPGQSQESRTPSEPPACVGRGLKHKGPPAVYWAVLDGRGGGTATQDGWPNHDTTCCVPVPAPAYGSTRFISPCLLENSLRSRMTFRSPVKSPACRNCTLHKCKQYVCQVSNITGLEKAGGKWNSKFW